MHGLVELAASAGGELPPPSPMKATLVLLKELDAGSGGKAEAAEEDPGAASTRAVIATHLPAGLSDPADTGRTILTALTSSEPRPLGFSQLQKRPVLREKRLPPPQTPKVQTPQREQKQEPASKTLSAPHHPVLPRALRAVMPCRIDHHRASPTPSNRRLRVLSRLACVMRREHCARVINELTL